MNNIFIGWVPLQARKLWRKIFSVLTIASSKTFVVTRIKGISQLEVDLVNEGKASIDLVMKSATFLTKNGPNSINHLCCSISFSLRRKSIGQI